MNLGNHPFSMPSRAEERSDFPLYPESPNMYSPPTFPYSAPNPMFPFSDVYTDNPVTTAFNPSTLYAEAPVYNSPEMRGAPSNYSTGNSAPSSAMGSPPSYHGQFAPAPQEWPTLNVGPPVIASYDNQYTPGSEFSSFQTTGMEDNFALQEFVPKAPGFVDPSILHPGFNVHMRPASATQSIPEVSAYPPPPSYPNSPSMSHISRSPQPMKAGSQSPYMNSQRYHPYSQQMRRQSVQSHRSFDSQEDAFSSEESRGKGRCTYPECGKIFKDLKAHMLTHQNERPEKCPIVNCEYNIKGFARKYDKNRHTLTHYKGDMVCGFCPKVGSTAEKSFNRADVFKRHLTSVHGVEQTPPNSRKKTSGTSKKMVNYDPDNTATCSTCSTVFGNAQDFYEHLDDCVLRTVQQEEPSEAINAARLAEVAEDKDVHETLRNNSLPTTTINTFSAEEDDEDEEFDDENDDDFTPRSKSSRKGRANRNPVNGVQKSRGLTHSKGGVALNTKGGRKKRKDYPGSWGCPQTQMKMKKRVLCVFDGARRLWKDDMMLDSDYEVRVPLNDKPDDKSYVTDLDIATMRRADAFHNADESEKGPWISDDLSTVQDLEKLMENHE